MRIKSEDFILSDGDNLFGMEFDGFETQKELDAKCQILQAGEDFQATSISNREFIEVLCDLGVNLEALIFAMECELEGINIPNLEVERRAGLYPPISERKVIPLYGGLSALS